ncbi:MAG: phosphoribosylglycinamide formyltransferase [Defluviitaleaceae bacterium]|nr:phosphoribosylglycinamide formyltransferase [Defluviitaleaceae bacterium]
MYKIAVLASGGGTNLQALIDARNAGNLRVEIALVIVSKPDAYAAERARQNNIPVLILSRKDIKNRDKYTRLVATALNDHNVQLTVFAGWLVILSPSFFDIYMGKSINIHPAILPDFGGAGFFGLHVHEAVLAAKVAQTGATVHYVTEGVDEGPIILQKFVDIQEGDTPETLQLRVMEEAERPLLVAAVNLIAGGA